MTTVANVKGYVGGNVWGIVEEAPAPIEPIDECGIYGTTNDAFTNGMNNYLIGDNLDAFDDFSSTTAGEAMSWIMSHSNDVEGSLSDENYYVDDSRDTLRCFDNDLSKYYMECYCFGYDSSQILDQEHVIEVSNGEIATTSNCKLCIWYDLDCENYKMIHMQPDSDGKVIVKPTQGTGGILIFLCEN